jgi:hypothetical protein
MADVPGKLGRHVYIVGMPTPKWVLLECPCRCGERIDVNLMASRRPAWKLDMHDGQVTLYPSLWMPDEKCGSHFWVRGNRIRWVDATRRQF